MTETRARYRTPVTTHANRGLVFEQLIELANRCYRTEGIAVIHKVPTAWLPLRRDGRVVSAKVEQKAAVDFLGVWRGRSIAFDAKECSGTRWPLSNLAEHQWAFLRDWQAGGGLSFLLISLPKHGSVHLLTLSEYDRRDRAVADGGRMSILEAELLALPRCTETDSNPCDYLATVERVLGGE